MSTLDLARAEIKSWERDFASRHGRDPTVQDIRDQPSIAEKYKLYKKLSKSLPKTRPLDAVPPLPGFNPFSPVKKTASLPQSVQYTSRPSSRQNLFTTPTKDISKPCLVSSSNSPSSAASTSASCVLPVAPVAVSRARKRLRGEPVSPSPSKPKRQRVRSQALPSLLEQDLLNSEHGADQGVPYCNFSSSFIVDSPVKAPAGGKSFKLLFDDALPVLSVPTKPAGSSITQLDSLSDANSSRASVDLLVTTSHKLHRDLTSNGIISGTIHAVDHPWSNTFPMKDCPSASSYKPLSTTVTSAVLQPRTSTKRALNSDNIAHEDTGLSTSLQSRYPFVPPSPPLQDPINRDIGKGKAAAIISRKKLRIEDEESDGADSLDDASLRVAIVDLGPNKNSHQHTDDFDWDPLLFLGTRNHDSQRIDANHHVSSTFNLELPEKFRRVLAISPSRTQNRTEERVVRGLLYGDRVGHYDPSRGGVIWDAGEADDSTNDDAEKEDDWESEPIPWEVGEL